MNNRGPVAMVITEQKTFEACKMVVMGVDHELVHQLRIATMTALEGLKEDAAGKIQVSGFAKKIIGECPPALMQERILDTLDILAITDAVLDVVEEEADEG
jgi:hypothetical protein